MSSLKSGTISVSALLYAQYREWPGPSWLLDYHLIHFKTSKLRPGEALESERAQHPRGAWSGPGSGIYLGCRLTSHVFLNHVSTCRKGPTSPLSCFPALRKSWVEQMHRESPSTSARLLRNWPVPGIILRGTQGHGKLPDSRTGHCQPQDKQLAAALWSTIRAQTNTNDNPCLGSWPPHT